MYFLFFWAKTNSMTYTETAFTFTGSNRNQLVGIIHNPKKMAGDIGLLIVVGGPQYRIGAHRQYVHMARHAAGLGIPVMRFDYQGVGDSDGDYPGFEHVGPDIHHAIDEFLRQTPAIRSLAIWGLCEGASAILLGGANHKSVSHIILANPWVRSESGLAKAYVKHYYFDRLKSPEFWRKIFSGNLKIKSALSGLKDNIKKAFGKKTSEDAPAITPEENGRSFVERMLSGMQDFQGKILLQLSGNDLVAREFDDLTSGDKAWRRTIRQKISDRADIAESDHTFSTEEWRRKVAVSTADWLLSEKISGQ